MAKKLSAAKDGRGEGGRKEKKVKKTFGMVDDIRNGRSYSQMKRDVYKRQHIWFSMPIFLIGLVSSLPLFSSLWILLLPRVVLNYELRRDI